MKKTLTVNLGGTVFHIDEDAYCLLDNYLSNLKIHFRKEAGADEIIDDIERRISELFTRKTYCRVASDYYCRCGRSYRTHGQTRRTGT